MKFFSDGCDNLIPVFVAYIQYIIHDNDPVGYGLVQAANDDFN